MFRGNKIYKIDQNGKKKRIFKFKGIKIKFKGKNSTIIIYEPLRNIRNSKIECGSNCTVEIGASQYNIKKLNIWCWGDNNICKIGKNFSCTSSCEIMLHKENNLSVLIGEDCMFAKNVQLRTSDAHTIYDIETNEIQNFGKSISIGNHCWLAFDVAVFKGVTIPDNCVIGANSLVTKKCKQPNAIYVGTPAKLIKTGINWRREAP